MKKILETIRDIFPYALLIYLLFFLLEVLLPGFVSNNFDLNYLLVAVIILGFFSVFAPPIEKIEELPQKSDRNLIIILSILSFLVLLFRTKDMGMSGLIIAIVGSLLTAGMSAMIIYFPDEDEEEPVDEIKTENFAVSQPIKLPRFNALTYLRPGIALIIMIIIVFFAYRQINKKTVNTNQKVPSPTPTVAPIVEEVEEIIKPDEETLQKVSFEVLNGSLKVGSASAMAEFLKEKGFNVARTGDADRSDYQNLLIRFRPEEYEIVKYLINIVQGIYPSIVREPLSTDSAKVIMILGKP
jgi:hypothetical protein